MNNKSHPDNILPVWLVKEKVDVFAPIFRTIINKSFREGKYPSSLKLGTVRPVIKEKNSDTENYKNFRPVTNIPFLPKLIEKAANNQIQKYLKENDLYPPNQSAYREAHSCETAMFNIVNNIQKSVQEKKMVMLVLLDLSSAFDTIDQDILLFKLLHHFGIGGTVLEWLKTYLKGRSFCVRIRNVNGKRCLLIYGVPQGTVLGPLLFSLYIHDITAVATKHEVSIDLYADDSKWYLSFSPLYEKSEAIRKMQNCMSDLKFWMEDNFLKVNFDKTDVLFLGNPLFCNIFAGYLGCTIQGKDFVYNLNSSLKKKSLGVYLDSALSMNKMVNDCVKDCYFQLKKLGGIKRLLDTDMKITMVQSYILSRLDFCNSLYCNISVTLLNKLHSLLNACIRFIYGCSRQERNLDTYYKQSHILPMKYRIMFKLCLIAFKILNNLSPVYLQNVICFKIPVIGTRLLRSSLDFYQVELPRQRDTNEYIMAEYWNALPINIRLLHDIDIFKRDLKTYFFTLAFS